MILTLLLLFFRPSTHACLGRNEDIVEQKPFFLVTLATPRKIIARQPSFKSLSLSEENYIGYPRLLG